MDFQYPQKLIVDNGSDYRAAGSEEIASGNPANPEPEEIGLTKFRKIVEDKLNWWLFQVEKKGVQKRLHVKIKQDDKYKYFREPFCVIPADTFELKVHHFFVELIRELGIPDYIINLDRKSFDSGMLKRTLGSLSIKYTYMSMPIEVIERYL